MSEPFRAKTTEKSKRKNRGTEQIQNLDSVISKQRMSKSWLVSDWDTVDYIFIWALFKTPNKISKRVKISGVISNISVKLP